VGICPCLILKAAQFTGAWLFPTNLYYILLAQKHAYFYNTLKKYYKFLLCTKKWLSKLVINSWNIFFLSYPFAEHSGDCSVDCGAYTFQYWQIGKNAKAWKMTSIAGICTPQSALLPYSALALVCFELQNTVPQCGRKVSH